MYKINVIVNVFLFLSLSTGIVMADVVENCMDVWNDIYANDEAVAVERKLSLWQANQVKCNVEGIYEYGRAKFLAQAQSYDAAKKVLEPILNIKAKFQKEYQLLFADIEFNIAAHKSQARQSEWTKVKENFNALISKYPDWHGGYLGLANLEMGFERYEQAKKLFIKANGLQQSALAYRALTIIAEMEKEYDIAIENADIAYQLDDTLLSDKDFVVAMATSYMHLDKSKVGLNLLEILVQKNDAAKKDNVVLKLGAELYQRVNK